MIDFGGPAMRTTHVALLGVLLLTTACTKPDVTKSAEYAALQRRLDGATADLGDARDELAAAKSQVERLDGNAAAMETTAESQKTRIRDLEAEGQAATARAAEADAIKAAFVDVLAISFQQDGYLGEQDARCVANAIVDSDDARQSLLPLVTYVDEAPLTSEQLTAAAALVDVFAGCGLDYATLPEPAAV
jgi:prophage DNA circulation protein